MANAGERIAVYLEVGEKRVIAGAVEWPGWCRSGRDEEAALGALLTYAPRYAAVLKGTRLGFGQPDDARAFAVVERLKGNSTTDFGAPDCPPQADKAPFGEDECRRAATILRASWRAFDRALAVGEGKTLKTGPRGGGRAAEGIAEHVLMSEAGYLKRLGQRYQRDAAVPLAIAMEELRDAVLAALDLGVRGEIPERGPRGGKIWSPHFFVRRDVWHILDHAWEIEDRIAD